MPDEPERIIEELLRSVHTPRGGEVAEPSAADARDAWPTEPALPPATVSVLPVAGCIRRFVLTILVLLALGALILLGLLAIGGQLFGAVEGTRAPLNTLEQFSRGWSGVDG